MSTVNWDLFKCRCSGIKKLLANGVDGQQITEKQEVELKRLEDIEKPSDKQVAEIQRLRGLKANRGKIVLGDTAIEYLMEVYSEETEGMIAVGKEAMDLMPLRKGKRGENQASELLSLVDGNKYSVHKERISNNYLSGEIDLYVGEEIYKAKNITDIKNAFDYPTFLKKLHKGLEQGQKEQLQGYGDITGAQELYIANCLISFSPDEIEDTKWKLMKKMNVATEESPEFIETWVKVLQSMIFEKIAPQKRVFKIKVEPFSDYERQKVYDRVKFAREFLWKFDEEHENRNK